MKSAPTTDRGRVSAERIVDAACELFHAQGVRATGLDQVAKLSKTGKGQIYHFFSGKSDLLLAVVEQQTERVLAAQQPYLDAMRTAADLVAWAEFMVRSHEGADGPMRCPLGALAAELTDDAALQDALRTAFARWRGAIADGLARLAEDGGLPLGSDLTAQAELLLGAYQGGVLLSRVQRDSDPLRRMLTSAVAQVLDGGSR